MDRFDWLELSDVKPSGRMAEELEQVRPHDGPSYFNAARLLRQAGHFRSAVEFYEKAVGFQPHHYQAWVELVDTLVRGRQLDAADRWSAKAVDSYRQVRVLYASRALVLNHRGNLSEAEKHLQVALDGEEPSWYTKCVEAECLLRANAPHAHALTRLERATDWAEDTWEPHFLAGWMLLDAQLPVLAAGHFAEACHWNPAAPLVWLCLGDCFRDLKLHDQAAFYYERVLDLEPKHLLARKRRDRSARKVYGLLRQFDRQTLEERWRHHYEDQQGSAPDR